MSGLLKRLLEVLSRVLETRFSSRFSIIRRPLLIALIMGLVSTSLMACSDKTNNQIQNVMGLTGGSPDEFTVVSYPPLTVPPTLHKCGAKPEEQR